MLLWMVVSCTAPAPPPVAVEATSPPTLEPPPPEAAPPVRAIAVGEEVSCALVDPGDVRCWGSNRDGRAGLGDVEGSPVPVSIGLTDVVALDVGTWHGCAVKADGTLWCWGRNYGGVLGLGDEADRAVPTQVPGLSGIVEVVTGGVHTCARDGEGEVWCFGHRGAVGHRESVPSNVPGKVERLGPARDLVAGDQTTCAWLVEGPPACWGFATAGLLGDALGPVLGARTSEALDGAAALTIGNRHACVVDTEGVVTCGGRDWDGELGGQRVPDGATCRHEQQEVVCTWRDPPPERPRDTSRCKRCPDDEASDPVERDHEKRFPDRNGFRRVWSIPAAEAVVAGYGRTCSVDIGGTVTCWGRGVGGERAWSHRTPGPVAGLDDVVSLSLHRDHGCALRADHTVRCFGENRYGEVGSGSVTESAAPEPVSEVVF